MLNFLFEVCRIESYSTRRNNILSEGLLETKDLLSGNHCHLVPQAGRGSLSQTMDSLSIIGGALAVTPVRSRVKPNTVIRLVSTRPG